jgi:TonB family protein
MKYCPTCETRYDEEILRFCMKDGTPLIEEEEPSFTTMPSESFANEDDESDEVTVIRRNSAPPPPPDVNTSVEPRDPAQRIVVPTYEDQQPRTRVAPPYQAPTKPNTAKVVLLTIIGTLAVVIIAGSGLWFLQKDRGDNTNVNTSPPNTNLNTNLNLDNFNFNASGNFNSNTNSNVNTVRTPTPTPTPKPSPSVTPTPSPSPTEEESPDTNTRPRSTPSPIPSPRVSPTPPDRPVNGGVLNGRALSLPVPTYPTFAKQVGANGEVRVQVMVDERGNVVSAKAVSGHPLLRSAAESAARQSKISPARIGEQNVRTTGFLLYNFRNN